jgi:6,7-dimethyl-8-ribityllumazine synthase
MSQGTTDPAAEPRLKRPARIAAVVSRYHPEITGSMFDSARATLIAAGLAPGDLLRLDAPGSFELPVLAQRMALRRDVDAVLCFGLILKGETEHDRYLASAVSHGLMRVALEEMKPVLFGVLTCSDLAQAETRARPRAAGGLDKGAEVARAAVEAINALVEVGSGRYGEEGR